MKKNDNIGNIMIKYGNSSAEILQLINYKEVVNTVKKNNTCLIKNNLENSLSEVYDIIMHSERDIINKIPKKFIKFIEENRNQDYIVNINYNININSQKLLKNTKLILSMIYRDYLVDNERKVILLQSEEEKIRNEYEVKWKTRKRSDESNIPNDEDNNKSLNIDKMQLIEVNGQSLWKKIIDKIKRLKKDN